MITMPLFRCILAVLSRIKINSAKHTQFSLPVMFNSLLFASVDKSTSTVTASSLPIA